MSHSKIIIVGASGYIGKRLYNIARVVKKLIRIDIWIS